MPAIDLPAGRCDGGCGVCPQRAGAGTGPGRAAGRAAAAAEHPGRRPAAGQAYFDAKCSSCHSTTGDLAGHCEPRVTTPTQLQNLWVGGGRQEVRASHAMPTEPVAMGRDRHRHAATGPHIEGRLERIDDFSVTVMLQRMAAAARSAGWATSRRSEIRDPLAGTQAAAADLHGSRHPQCHGLSGDPEMRSRLSLLSRCRAIVVRRDRPLRSASVPPAADGVGRCAGVAASRRSPTRGRPTRATTPAGATARSRRSIARR